MGGRDDLASRIRQMRAGLRLALHQSYAYRASRQARRRFGAGAIALDEEETVDAARRERSHLQASAFGAHKGRPQRDTPRGRVRTNHYASSRGTAAGLIPSAGRVSARGPSTKGRNAFSPDAVERPAHWARTSREPPMTRTAQFGRIEQKDRLPATRFWGIDSRKRSEIRSDPR